MSSNWPDAEPNDLDNLEIDPSFIAEANAFTSNVRTVPTGEYQIQAHSFDWEVGDGKDKRIAAGRKYARVRFDIFAKDNTGGKPLATVFASISPEANKVTYNGRSFLDNPSQLFGQAAKAFGVKTVGEVRDGLAKYPVIGFIKEQYKTLAGQYVTPTGEEQRVALIDQGAKPYLDLRSIKAV